jgi:hypothetical protein
MEVFGIIGFVFGLSALVMVIELKEQLKESGVLKDKSKKDKRQLLND